MSIYNTTALVRQNQGISAATRSYSYISEALGLPGYTKRKVRCPECGKASFSIAPGDRFGHCWRPTCGHRISTKNTIPTISTILQDVYADWHQALLDLPNHPYSKDAYQYLTGTHTSPTFADDTRERGIHPDVVEDAMLGIIPSNYPIEEKFAVLITHLQQAEKETAAALSKQHPTKAQVKAHDEAVKQLDDTQGAVDKIADMVHGHHAGWLVFFYVDAKHRIVSLKFRKPYSKEIRSWKPKPWAGVFGHGMFEPYTDQPELNNRIIVLEGEFNLLQLQSLMVRTNKDNARDYMNACAVGGVQIADMETVRRICQRPIICYDNDANQAGFELVRRAQQLMTVDICTTPGRDSDADSFILSFGAKQAEAKQAVKQILSERQTAYRVYAGKGEEFHQGRTFIPKLLADAIMERHPFRYAFSRLWIYEHGVYHPDDQQRATSLAHEFLGQASTTRRVQEAIAYIQRQTITLDETTLDTDHINVCNGLLDWRTGKLRPHTWKEFRIVQLPVDYDPDATCPVFDRYLETSLPADIHPLVEEALGYALIPDTRFEKAFMLTGAGRNGKSVLLDTLVCLLGRENVSNASLESITNNRFAAAGLHGKLANVCPDLDPVAIQSAGKFKMLVTGDRMAVERKFEQGFSFSNYARLFFSANELPTTYDRTYAFYRRWIIIPFGNTFDEGTGEDKTLREKIHRELPGVLNRAIAGLRRLMEHERFTEPEVVRQALQSYQQQNDTVAAFLAESVEQTPVGNVSKQALYTAYCEWCGSQGFKAMDQRKLRDTLLRTCPKVDEYRAPGGKGPWQWLGIRLMTENVC